MARLRGSGRVLAIVAAVALAGFATWAILVYVRGIEARAFEDAELVEVFVAEESIAAGTTAEEASEAGLFARDTAPRGNVPDGAIGSLDQIAGLVALESVLEGEVILRGRWGDPALAELRFDIPEGFEAVSVQVGIPPGVAGFVRPGDRVSLIAHLAVVAEEQEVDEEGVVTTTEVEEARAQYLLQDVEVLATGQRVATGEAEEGTGSVLLTLALVPEEAERLVLAIHEANLYFTLLPEDAEPASTPGRTLPDLFD